MTFQGTMSSEEMDVVVEAGLNYLFKTGALPFTTIGGMEISKFSPVAGNS